MRQSTSFQELLTNGPLTLPSDYRMGAETEGMNHSVDDRSATVVIGTALAGLLLAVELQAAELIPALLWDASRIALAPAFLLVGLLRTNVLWGGLEDLWGLFPVVRDSPPLAWDLGIALLVSYAVAFVGVQLGILIDTRVDWFTQRPWLASGVGTVVTVGVVAFVGMTVRRVARDPFQGQEFYPQAVAGALTLALLVVVAAFFSQARTSPR